MVLKILIGIILAVGISVLFTFLYVYCSPQVGKDPTIDKQISYEKTGHYNDKKFISYKDINLSMSFNNVRKVLKEIINPDPYVIPKNKLQVSSINPETLKTNKTNNRITWMGHSTILVEMGGKIILIDPVFDNSVSPVPFLGKKRFYDNMPISLEEIPEIDAIIISHDHYDHLEYKTIIKLMEKTKRFYVPLGIENHLLHWGVDGKKIYASDWWQKHIFDDLHIIFAPAVHFSGRKLNNRNSTLWGSWIIKDKEKSIYFSGDSGYGNHFQKIGEKYGPFDLAMMECGQYNKNWADVHMFPEETVQATIDLKAQLLLPIHWGAFTLAPHSWIDPIERVISSSIENNLAITTPAVGEPIILGKDNPDTKWWTK